MLGQKEIDTLVPDVNVRVSAINFLLSTVRKYVMCFLCIWAEYINLERACLRWWRKMAGSRYHIKQSWRRKLKCELEACIVDFPFNNLYSQQERNGRGREYGSEPHPVCWKWRSVVWKVKSWIYSIMLRSGIWTKHLKGKTELHQTVINRCLKSLEQKGLIKAVKSVKVRISCSILY